MATDKDVTVTKETLIEWLNEVPDGAEIRIDIGQFGQRDLVAIADNDDQWILAVSGFPELPDSPDDDEEGDPNTNGQQP